MEYISYVNVFSNWIFCKVELLGFGAENHRVFFSGEKLAVALYSDMAHLDCIALSQKQGNEGR